MTALQNETKVFLNTWGAYNNGCIGFGWMTPQEAIDFMYESLENESFILKHGEEFFIADIDNYLGIDFGSLEYCDVEDVCNSIIELEDMQDWEQQEVIAVMEYRNCDVWEAIDKKDHYIIYSDIDTFYSCMDELVDMEIDSSNSIIARYFDYEAYHRDCMFDAYECLNGVIICE